MDDNYRSYPYYSTNNNNNKRYQHQYSSSHRFDNPCLQRNQYQQSKSTDFSYHSPLTTPLPLMMTDIGPPPTLITAIPHERESWIRSVKKTKLNESTEQKTQYLETMLRMPHPQKSSINSSTFDRIRFADDQISITTNTLENNNNLGENSFHLINNINNHDEICTIEKILFNHEVQSRTQIIDCAPTLQTNSEAVHFSGFLIDDCDEEELIPLSSPPALCLRIEESIQHNQEDLTEQRAMLVNELNTAEAEQRQELKRQKRFQKKCRKKKHTIKSNKISNVNNNNHQELPSDWVVEYDTAGINRIGQLTDMIRRTSTTITDENKTAKVNLILKKIKKQQKELQKLKRYVISMLDEGQQQQQNSTNSSRQNSNNNQDLLMTFLNQPLLSGCWFCSGKTYTEAATQCNSIDQL